MKLRRLMFTCLIAMTGTAGVALAQYDSYDTMSTGTAVGMGIAFLIVWLLFAAAFYVFFAICVKKVAEKTGHADKAWWAWVPILNALLILEIGGKPAWWIIIFPIGYIITIFELPKLLGKDPIWGVITLFFGPIGWGYFAFSDSTPPAAGSAA